MDSSFVEAMQDNLGADSNVVDGVTFVHKPDSWNTEPLITEPYLEAPTRMRGTMTLADLGSFVAYVDRVRGGFGLGDGSKLPQYFPGAEILFNRSAGTYACHFNHHGGWGDYLAIYQPRQTTAWKKWKEYSGKFVTQEEFAAFLEDRIAEIYEPAGAALFEMANSLKVSVNATFSKDINRQTGGATKLIWTEDVKTGEVQIPEKLTLVITPFVGGEAITGTARLKFTTPRSEKGVHFGIFLGEEFEYALDAAFDAMSDKIFAATGIPVIQGTWQSPMKPAS